MVCELHQTEDYVLRRASRLYITSQCLHSTSPSFRRCGHQSQTQSRASFSADTDEVWVGNELAPFLPVAIANRIGFDLKLTFSGRWWNSFKADNYLVNQEIISIEFGQYFKTSKSELKNGLYEKNTNWDKRSIACSPNNRKDDVIEKFRSF